MLPFRVLTRPATLATLISLVVCAPVHDPAPTVSIAGGSFVGSNDGITKSFFGIPYAQPPTGNLRFNLPQPVEQYSGVYNATVPAAGCPGLDLAAATSSTTGPMAELNELLNSAFSPPNVTDENCLTLNIWTPAHVLSGADLPVAVYIHGGGFVSGASASYDGEIIVKRALELGQPLIYANLNYRLSAYGFLAGQEVKDAGVTNLGLRDQRQALSWLNQHIRAFGGDPSKVTIWGESSGALSIMYQMLHNNGSTAGLFRGAFMESGSALPLNNYTEPQSVYDSLVSSANCTDSSNTLECLRELPFEAVQTALSALSPESLASAFQPVMDFDFIPDDPPLMVSQGRIANIAFVNGDTDDEGTEIALDFSSSVSTDAEVATWLSTSALPGASQEDVEQVMSLYPANVTEGSPFDTGTANAITPQYKRLAAIETDLLFQAPRRFLLGERWDKQPTWSFLSKLFKSLPDIGSGHQTDLLNIYGPGVMTDYLVNFVTNLNPNNATGVFWPSIMEDTFRKEGTDLLTRLGQEFPE
ncbi:hypothetical protein CERSUDRAFT_117706 [Gelatoporia subvermispora B]|uniref:Carboxylic ester hydrolase n=1 Tax=Ceriporiopsis subvermispora (strain B) TaxID=914234 RepID=M2QN44_CERS8|nr:hypothetical protein CERSUDRAFT_117706 [Gelatoporia subvermispora B]